MTRALDDAPEPHPAPSAAPGGHGPAHATGRILLFALPGVPWETLHLAVELAEASELAPAPVQAWLTLDNRRHLPVRLDSISLGEGVAGIGLQDAGWVQLPPAE